MKNGHYKHYYQYTKNQLGDQRKYPKRNSTHTKNSNGTKLFSIQTQILQKKKEGLAMGAATSTIYAEACIQNMGHRYSLY
jgi:hypothetical protein